MYSGNTEIVTVDAEPVQSVPNKIERAFLMERLLESIRRAQVAQQDGGALQQDGGAHDGSNTDTTPAPETAPIQYTDDTVDIVDTQAPDIQDTQATR